MISFLRNSKAHIFPIGLDDSIQITGDDAHHLNKVLRLKNKEHVSVAANGQVRDYEIEQIDSSVTKLNAVGDIQQVNEPQIELYVSFEK